MQISIYGEDLAPGKYRVLVQSADDSQKTDVHVELPNSTPWGTTVDGLQARLAVPEAEVPRGIKVDFQLHFRFDPKDVDAKLNLLNYGAAAWEAELVFNDTNSESVFRRRPFDRGMLRVTRPKDMAELRQGSLPTQGLAIHLLNDGGEQIPPGTYMVTAVYKNTAQPELEFWTDEDGNVRSRPYAGPWTFWTGTMTSAPITLTVKPAEPEEIELTINSALEITRGKDGDRDTIGWTWAHDAPITVKAKRRPGYVIGNRYVLYVFLDGRDIGRAASGMSNRAWHGGGGMSFLQPKIVERVLAGESLKLRADVEVFETSVPTRHRWMPQAGDLNILWQGSVEGELKRSADGGVEAATPANRRG